MACVEDQSPVANGSSSPTPGARKWVTSSCICYSPITVGLDMNEVVRSKLATANGEFRLMSDRRLIGWRS